MPSGSSNVDGANASSNAGLKMTVGSIREFNPNINNWIVYKKQLSQFFLINSITDPNIKRAFLLNNLSESAYSTLCDLLVPNEPDEVSYTEIVVKFDEHFCVKKSVWGERMLFYQAHQENSESIMDWAVRVRHLSTNCDFGTFLNIAIRDKFIFGMQKCRALEKLLQESSNTLDFKKAVEIAQSVESARNYYQESSNALEQSVKLEPQIHRVHTTTRGASRSPRHNERSARSPPRRKYSNAAPGSSSGTSRRDYCTVCGRDNHVSSKCRYKNYACNICHEKGHLSNVCKKHHNSIIKKTSHFLEVTENNQHDNDSFLHIFNINVDNKNSPIYLNVKLDDIYVDMELDSGSAITAFSKEFYLRNFAYLPLSHSTTSLISYSGTKIYPAGIVNLKISYNNKTHPIDIFVVDKGGPPLLGRDFMYKFNLCVKEINSIDVDNSLVNNLYEKYKEIFSSGVGTFSKGKIEIKLKTEAEPKFFKPRSLPFALREKVEDELNRLVNLNILKPVDYSLWGTPIVPVLKSDGTVRICGDYKITLNPVIELDRYPLPRIEDLFTKLQGGQTFSKIDLAHAYQQVLLSDESKMLTTISTHKGLFCYNRLPFGVSIGPSAFQKIMEIVLQGIPGVICFQDDILVTGRNMKEHIARLEKVFSCIKECGLKIKKEKCVFFQKSVSYLGFVLDKDGLRKSPEKVKAMLDAPCPTNKAQLQSYLGLLNYYRKFIPNMATIAHPLYRLLKNDVDWDWSESCQSCFDKLKKIIASPEVLVHYNPNLKLRLACDASPYGVGAVLSLCF